MDDLISRQAAIDVMKKHRTIFCDNSPESFRKLPYSDKSRVDEIDNCIAALVNLSTVHQWIPCSERLPEEDGLEVMFCSRRGRVHIGKYHDDASLNRWFSYRDKIRFMNDEVTAWMQLPEPYKGEEE